VQHPVASSKKTINKDSGIDEFVRCFAAMELNLPIYKVEILFSQPVMVNKNRTPV